MKVTHLNREEMEEASERLDANPQLRSFVERIIRLEDDADALKEDKKAVYAEAKGMGFDPRALRLVVKLKRDDSDTREFRYNVNFYLEGLGETPLFAYRAE